MSSRFDPRPYLRQLDSGELYLDVKWRLHWLRSEHPEAVIETQLISLEGDTAVCKAIVHIPGGGSATAHASANRAPGSEAAHIEQAENRAIGRALAALGYGAEYTEDDRVQARTIERPVSLVPPQPAPIATPTEVTPARMRPVAKTSETEPNVLPTRREEQPREGRSVHDLRESRQAHEIREQQAAESETPEPVPLKRGADLRGHADERPAERPPEDVSWTKFWEWAKRRGYRDAAHLRELLGIDVNALTPGEVRARIRRYELDHEAPGNAE